MAEKKILSEKEIEAKALKDSMASFYESKGIKVDPNAPVIQQHSGLNQNIGGVEAAPINPVLTQQQVPPQAQFNAEKFQNTMSQETDPDLLVGWDIVTLPSKGMFDPSGVQEVKVEYLTAKDEDLLTTPALLENGTVLDVLLKQKIKTPIDVDNMLTGDKNAILLFLRASSYGHKYEVNVVNPYSGERFKTAVDLTKLRYKEVEEMPDANGEFTVEIPMRKKIIKFRLLNHRENRVLTKQAETLQETYSTPYAQVSTLKIKSSIKQIGDRRDIDYIHKFVDAMPAGDALAIRIKMKEVEPDVDMNYEFVTPDGKLFNAPVVMGIDFFFPSL